ncbi:MAG: hypothetical protein H8K04_06660 [Nitrospira sp.]
MSIFRKTFSNPFKAFQSAAAAASFVGMFAATHPAYAAPVTMTGTVLEERGDVSGVGVGSILRVTFDPGGLEDQISDNQMSLYVPVPGSFFLGSTISNPSVDYVMNVFHVPGNFDAVAFSFGGSQSSFGVVFNELTGRAFHDDSLLGAANALSAKFPLFDGEFSYSDGLGNTLSGQITGVHGNLNLAPVPLPGAVFLFGSGLLGLAGLRRRFLTKQP